MIFNPDGTVNPQGVTAEWQALLAGDPFATARWHTYDLLFEAWQKANNVPQYGWQKTAPGMDAVHPYAELLDQCANGGGELPNGTILARTVTLPSPASLPAPILPMPAKTPTPIGPGDSQFGPAPGPGFILTPTGWSKQV